MKKEREVKQKNDLFCVLLFTKQPGTYITRLNLNTTWTTMAAAPGATYGLYGDSNFLYAVSV